MKQAVIIGGSAGSFAALKKILSTIPKNFPHPIIVVTHLHPQQDGYYVEHINNLCKLHVKEADEKEKMKKGFVYTAPPNYHLLIEQNYSFSLTVDPKVNYSRPSIDTTFESLVDVFGGNLIGVILTGANNDGAYGLHLLKQSGGIAIVEDPKTASSPEMPGFAIAKTDVDFVLPVEEIGKKLTKLVSQ